MRLDKFTWATRLFKTRSLASKASLAEKVKLNAAFSKPSKAVAIGDTLAVKDIPIWRTYKIIDLPKSRVGAKLVSNYLVETTPEEDLLQLEQIREANRQNRFSGIKGRPTKKVRRNFDQSFN